MNPEKKLDKNNKINYPDDTICAISTPVGRGAISLIRISGNNAFAIISSVFSGKRNINEVDGNSIVHGHIIEPETGEIIDEVLLFIYRRPSSYTGEDMIEVSTHGGFVIPGKVLDVILKQGARHAEPGEFTRRAFLNNKMTLLEAEALLNVVEVRTEKGMKIAEDNLNGRIREELTNLKHELIDVNSLLEVSLDFEDRDKLEVDRNEISRKMGKIKRRLQRLSDSYRGGRILIDGIKLAIVGKPNVGKSSLFNTILQEDKAIVTSKPGTTRDILEGIVDINGYTVSFMDMAGIRAPTDEVEKIGVERAERMIELADGIIFVLDNSDYFDEEDRKILERISSKPYLTVINKNDLTRKLKEKDFFERKVRVSAKEHTGIEKLNRGIVTLIEDFLPEGFSESPVCTTERQYAGIRKAIEMVERGLEGIKAGIDVELVAFDFREAIDSVNELTGEVTGEEVLDRIFSRFCIGK